MGIIDRLKNKLLKKENEDSFLTVLMNDSCDDNIYNGDTDIKSLKISFIVPSPIKGSGGHRNIYRAVKHLHDSGHKITVYYTETTEIASNVKNNVSEWFYDMGDIEFIHYVGHIKDSDVAVATWWKTAYAINNNRSRIKYPFYFVQDFEPSFYPMCSDYVLAENTYRMGFTHICSGPWCKDFLQSKYNAEAEYFQFPVNRNIYHPRERKKTNKNIIFFAKPEMNRRCFEIGLIALNQFKKLRPDIEIIMFGSNRLTKNDVPFDATILGLLPTLDDLAELYSNADLGIVFSTTNPSLVPYEMISCGCPIVDLDLDQALSKYGGSEDNVFLMSPEPKLMAEQLANVIDDSELLKRRTESGMKWVLEEFPSESDMGSMVENMIVSKIATGKISKNKV